MEFCVGRNYDIWNSDVRKLFRVNGIKSVFAGFSCIMREDLSRENILELRELLEKDGLHAATSHPPYGSYNQAYSLIRQSASDLEREILWMKEYIIRCGLLGMKAIPLHTSGAMLPQSEEWVIKCAQRYIRQLLPIAEKAGVILAIENTNHAKPQKFYPGMVTEGQLDRNRWDFDDTEKILDFVHEFQSPFVRICYDVGHSHLLGRMWTDLEAFWSDIVMFHLHDNAGVGDDAHLQPGYGNLNWNALFEKIKESKENAVLYVEASPRFKDLGLMMEELRALAEGRVSVKEGGFLKKDEDTGKIVILPGREVVSC